MLPTQPLRPSEEGIDLLMPPVNRSGMTLLEVLVACGILVFALSGIAAILPAAGSRLAESVAEDRAALMAANVYSDIQASGILSHGLFVTSTTAPPAFNITVSGSASSAKQLRTLAMGLNVTSIIDLPPGQSSASKVAPDYFFDQFHDSPPWPLSLLEVWPYNKTSPVEARRDFFIQDNLQFAANTLASQYENGTLGPRAFKRGVCWGATLAARGASLGPGSSATLTIAIFKKPGEIRGIDLTQPAAGGVLYELPAGLENVRSTFLKPCAYVLAIPPEVAAPDTPPAPKWFRINSSWTQQSENLAQRISYVSLPPEASTTYTTSTGSGKQLLVIGFAGLIRVDEYHVTLK
jgi:Tfp pilus assembly protein PilV